MPNFKTAIEKAKAFTGLAIFLVGLAICYLVVAFLFFDFDPANWGGFGRFTLCAVGLAWSFGFAHASSEEPDGQE